MATLLISTTFVVNAQSVTLPAPQIIAHRAGTADAPENTLPAIDKALSNGADAIWITLQLSKDDIPVLYRPSDLKELTDKSGTISSYTAQQLAKVDASVAFNKKHNIQDKSDSHIGIPTLDEVLRKYPDTTFYLDIKSPDANPATFANALKKTLSTSAKDEKSRFARTRVYSTDDNYLNALDKVNESSDVSHQIQRFESRNVTRTQLANITMDHKCELPADSKERWYGLELHRKVQVVEKYTLGEGRSDSVLSWDKEAMDCFRKNRNSHIIFFGINTPEAYEDALKLQANGVMVDSPALFKQITNNKKPTKTIN
ncbi:glycerophosphodiester phosphodiesterase family protein [Yersinia pekkanenii]|nr:glycerophosphodiester phosphodiesterase family protein [Yersinia pekkanenii]